MKYVLNSFLMPPFSRLREKVPEGRMRVSSDGSNWPEKPSSVASRHLLPQAGEGIIRYGLLVCMIAISSLASAETTLRFQPHITPFARQLGDVLLIQKDTHHWSRLPLESHPIAGEIIQNTAIMVWMTHQLGPIKTHWEGRTHITVTQVAQTTGKALIEKAQISLIQQLSPHYTRVEVKPLSLVNDSAYALDDFESKVTIGYPTQKRVCVWLEHKHHKAPRIAVWFRVRAYAPVWIAKKDMHANTPLTPDAFIKKQQNIAGMCAPPAQEIPQHHWLKSPLTHHAVLLDNQLKAIPLVMHGQHLNVFTHHHSITVVINAIALSDGYLGDTITVKNPINQKTFTATIQGFQHAEIAL